MSVSVLVNGSPTVVADEIPAGAVFYLSNLLSIYTGSGWLTCNGTAVSRTTYAQLFAAIGTTFGAGDGVTTFNVPTRAQLNTRANVTLTTGTTFNAFAEDTDIIVNNTVAASIDSSAGALIAGIRISIVVKSTLGVTIYTDGAHTQSCLLPQGTFVLEWDGAQWCLVGKSTTVKVQFTTSTTWKTPFAAVYTLVPVGGGGSGGITVAGATNGGGGGGGGATVCSLPEPAGTILTITVGAGGTNASGAATTISDGTYALLGPGGGIGGASTSTANGTGGTGGLTTPTVFGQVAFQGGFGSGTTGGKSVWGLGNGGAATAPGGNYGGGGGGAVSTGSNGGHGGTGCAFIEF